LYQAVAEELGERVRIIKIDVDKNNEIASRYSVQSVPTLIVFKNGKLVWRQSGIVSKSQLESILMQNI
jgi:thioredoxin 1